MHSKWNTWLQQLGVAALFRLILSKHIAQRPTNLGGCLTILAKLDSVHTLTKRSFTMVRSNTSSIVQFITSAATEL